MSKYAELRENFRTDNYEKVREAFEEGDTLVILFAAVLSSIEQLEFSQKMIWTIAQGVTITADANYALSMLNEIINDDKQLVVSPRVQGTLDRLVQAQLGTNDADYDSVCEAIDGYLTACPDADFDQFLYCIDAVSLTLGLPDEVVFVALERARRRINNDQIYFFALYSSVLLFLTEDLALSLLSAQESIDYDMGLNLEKTKIELPIMEYDDFSPSFWAAWSSKRPRRRRGRRHQL